MYIHTVYRPQEHVDHIEDWLKYHTAIGVNHFFLYDNGESTGYGENLNNLEWDRLLHTDQNSGITRYGFKIKHTVEKARLIEQEILAKYSVTKVNWKPSQNGKIIYGYNDSIRHLLTQVKTGLCAFIDIDEYIVKREEFRPSRMHQVRYEDYHKFSSIFKCKNKLKTYNSVELGPKCIVDLEKLKIDDELLYPNTMHFFSTELPLSTSHFNHYNFNKVAYRELEKIHKGLPIYSNCFEYEENPFKESIVDVTRIIK